MSRFKTNHDGLKTNHGRLKTNYFHLETNYGACRNPIVVQQDQPDFRLDVTCRWQGTSKMTRGYRKGR
ncbi:hypothetical protein [Geomesophilobacter sediminis]|uniref:Uncharacterized protein n=1 Tax=Geomesophilobacter sediminis TaxID=2798584 RepID=A0A8J7JM18_9BACT|nr:hypothetical protein [Geomesophilobacter sediminis]MBJ6725450.1 hypothetical protein [Geomesophilobacter sediminis]